MLDYKIILKVDGEVNQTCRSEFVAINNHHSLVLKYGYDRVTVERVKIPGKWCEMYAHKCSMVKYLYDECDFTDEFECDSCKHMYVNEGDE